MAAPIWFFISFLVLLSFGTCSSQPIDVHTIKSKEADHHHHKAHTLRNIDIRRGGGGFGIVGGGGFGIGIGGDGRFGIDIGGVVPVYNYPGYGSPIYIPGFDFPINFPACGYVCPANYPTGEITEFKISGLSDFTRPYRCRPGPNLRGDKDYNQELLLHFVSPKQDKHENKQQHVHGGDVGHLLGGSRRLGFGRGSGSFDTSDQYDTEEPGSSFDGCGYVCPGNSPSGGITEFHISGLSNFTGPYRCRPDICDTEDCGEFLLHFVSASKRIH